MVKNQFNTKEQILIENNQLKKRIAELEKSELNRRIWIENSPVCTKIVDLDFNLKYMSSSGIRALKIEDITEYYGNPFPFSLYIDSSRIQMTKDLKRAKKTGETISQIAQVRDIEGKILWFDTTIIPVYSTKGELDYIMVVSMDFTANKEAEEALLQSEATIRNKLNVIMEPKVDIGAIELSDIIDTEALRSLMEGFFKLTGMLGAVLDVSGKVLVAVGWQDICTKFHRCNPKTLKNCIESDTILTQGVKEGTFKSYRCKNNMWDIVTPIIIDGRHLGNVFMGQYLLKDEKPQYNFFRKQARKYGFDEKEYLAALDQVPRFSQEEVEKGMLFYSELAGIISKLSYSSIQQFKMLTERKQTELDLIKAKEKAEESEGKLKAALKSMNDAVFISDQEGNFIEFNEAFATFHKFKNKEECKKTLEEYPIFLDVFHPDGEFVPLNMWVVSKALRGETGSNEEYILKRKDTAETWVGSYNYSPIRNNEGEIIGSVVTARDITELKNHEMVLRESEKKYRDLINLAQEGIWVIDKNNITSFANPSMAKMLGYSQEEMIGKSLFDFMDETGVKAANENLERRKAGLPDQHDFEFLCKNTKKIICTLSTAPILDKDGNYQGAIAGVMDITERKRAEEKIRKAEENLKNTFDLSPSIICKANLDAGFFIEANQAVTRILGYSVEEFTSTPFIELIHPDDQQKSTDEKDEQLEGKEVTFFENRYLCKDGSYKWMAWHGTKADENGIVTAIGSDISERKIIEQEIIETKQFYENIIEGVQDGIWVTDKNDVIFYANSAMEKIAGVPREQIQGNNLLKDFPKKTTGEIIKFYNQAKKEKKPIWYDIKVITPANKDTWQNGWLIPQYQNNTFTGIICTIHDVTEQKQAESSVHKLSTAVTQSPSIIVITDPKGKIEYVNPKFTELTGYTSSEAIGKESNILKSGKQDSAFYLKMWKTVKSGKVWRGQFHNKKKNSELFWEAASISSILNESGNIINYIKIGEDITQQKNTEIQLNVALEKALQSERLKSAFLANMSHEIRTPMNGILGFVNLLNEPNLTKTQIGQYSAIINKSGDRLLNTINDIIDISKIEAGEMIVSTSETHLNKVMDELFSFHINDAKLKGLSFLLEAPDENLILITDNHKLHGILTNLIKNAIKFTKKGQIIFGYSLKINAKAKSTEQESDVEVEFYVKDTGIGIPKDRINAIFNRFEQADIADTRVFEGSGLGLSISKAYIEMLDGKISVESEEGKGSTFTFTIPHINNAKKEINKNPKSIDNHPLSIEKMCLLIVEDDDVSSQLIETILEGVFGKIIYAVNGLEAVELCKSDPEINLILMDLKMPVMNGYKATQEIRKFNKEILIIAQTAFAMSGDKEKAIEAGCNDYISKPIDKDLLIEVIKSHLG